jgi:hypothetical protein
MERITEVVGNDPPPVCQYPPQPEKEKEKKKDRACIVKRFDLFNTFRLSYLKNRRSQGKK